MGRLPKSGSFVEISVKKKGREYVQVGTILPRPKLFDENIVVLKLENGYNVGIHKDNITSVKELDKKEKSSIKPSKIIQDKKLPKVVILSFGGTISSRLDYASGGVKSDYQGGIADQNTHDFLTMVPELTKIAQIELKQVDNLMSEDFDSAIYVKMAKAAQEELNRDDVVGLLITQGTDTLHFSTSALSFMLGELNKPVIFTASQRSTDRGSSDAFENLLCAVHAATKWDGATVATCMHESSNDGACILIRGTKVRKMHTSRRDAFRPINEQPLARVTPSGQIEVLNQNYPKRKNSNINAKAKFSENVGLVYVYPGIKPAQIEYFVKEKYEGLVVAATALGHVPTNIYDALQKCVDAGMLVVVASQTLYGRVHPFVYTNLRNLSIGIGLEFVDDMMPETAFTKVSWVIGNEKTMEKRLELLHQNIAGEFGSEIDELSYLN